MNCFSTVRVNQNFVEKGVSQKINILQLFGSIAELYLPMFVDTILEMTKGSDEELSTAKD
ncbi:MAG: hypothetical protein HC892_16575 [Saprospiraceae bacterium]|nr:hypothetical protein [Saprospiraceae bacterium]